MKKDESFAYATQLMIARTLSAKLGDAREDQREMSKAALQSAQQAVAALESIEDREERQRRLQQDEEARQRRMAAELDIGKY